MNVANAIHKLYINKYIYIYIYIYVNVYILFQILIKYFLNGDNTLVRVIRVCFSRSDEQVLYHIVQNAFHSQIFPLNLRMYKCAVYKSDQCLKYWTVFRPPLQTRGSYHLVVKKKIPRRNNKFHTNDFQRFWNQYDNFHNSACSVLLRRLFFWWS